MKTDSDDKGAIPADAIKPDASADANAEESTPDPRQEAFDVIVDKVEKEHIEEMGIEVDPEVDPKVDPKVDSEPKPKEGEPEFVKLDPAPAEEMVKIVVDGKESEVPLSKIIDAGTRTFQKESAADRNLAEANKLLKEVRELKAVKPAEPKPDEDAGSITDEELLHAIRYGEDDEALAAVRSLKGKSKTVDPADIDQKIDERLSRKSYDDILGRFSKSPEEGGYSDIFENDTNREYARIKVNELIAAGDGDDMSWETYQKAGDWVRETILGQKPIKTKTAAEILAEKEAKKRKIDPINPASSAIDKDVKTVDHEATLAETRSNTIAEMQAKREAR